MAKYTLMSMQPAMPKMCLFATLRSAISYLQMTTPFEPLILQTAAYIRWKKLASSKILTAIPRWWMSCMLRMLSTHSPLGKNFRWTAYKLKNGPKQKNYHRLLIYSLETSLQDRGLANSKLSANYDTPLYLE
jgi:hypothetical protein